MSILQAAKRLVPTSMQRRLRRARLLGNRQSIIRHAQRSRVVHLNPVNRVEHYFHFLFDLTLPLACLMPDLPEDGVVAIPEFGIFGERIPQIFGSRVQVMPREAFAQERSVSLIGMNPQFTDVELEEIHKLKLLTLESLGVPAAARPNKVLLIERLPPNDYFANQAVKKGAGASRRSIPNHAELQDFVASITPDEFAFCNVQLEELDFREQVALFDSAVAVVGQHGAGLANCVWMQRNNIVFEITHKPQLKHFQYISQVLGHQHLLHLTSGSHASIDVPEFSQQCRDVLLSFLAERYTQ